MARKTKNPRNLVGSEDYKYVDFSRAGSSGHAMPSDNARRKTTQL